MDPAGDIHAGTTESATLDFKANLNPDSTQDWCELVKDIVAMANSGGGTIVFGVNDDGTSSGADLQPILNVGLGHYASSPFIFCQPALCDCGIDLFEHRAKRTIE